MTPIKTPVARRTGIEPVEDLAAETLSDCALTDAGFVVALCHGVGTPNTSRLSEEPESAARRLAQ